MTFWSALFRKKGSVLFVGHCFYHTWYLSRELRKLGWKADTLNIDVVDANNIYYHGEDYKFRYNTFLDLIYQPYFFVKSLFVYDIYHFSNANNLMFGHVLRIMFEKYMGVNGDIWLLKKLGKKIIYSSNGCSDGVSQTSFSQWGDNPVCDICVWKKHPLTCSDERNLVWGEIRNNLSDYIITSGGNRADFNLSPKVHEVPEFYCADMWFLSPNLEIPDEYKLNYPDNVVKIYHSVGEYASRTDKVTSKNIKCTHIIVPTVERLKTEGYPVEIVFCTNISNKNVRYYQLQSDIVVDMLTYGWFGANVIEAMMLGVTCVCYIREEWMDIMRKEIPEYVDELPVVSATPDTIYSVLKDLIEHPEKREEIGKRSREFAVKWHSSKSGARRLDKIYSELLKKEYNHV